MRRPVVHRRYVVETAGAVQTETEAAAAGAGRASSDVDVGARFAAVRAWRAAFRGRNGERVSGVEPQDIARAARPHGLQQQELARSVAAAARKLPAPLPLRVRAQRPVRRRLRAAQEPESRCGGPLRADHRGATSLQAIIFGRVLCSASDHGFGTHFHVTS